MIIMKLGFENFPFWIYLRPLGVNKWRTLEIWGREKPADRSSFYSRRAFGCHVGIFGIRQQRRSVSRFLFGPVSDSLTAPRQSSMTTYSEADAVKGSLAKSLRDLNCFYVFISVRKCVFVQTCSIACCGTGSKWTSEASGRLPRLFDELGGSCVCFVDAGFIRVRLKEMSIGKKKKERERE